MSETPGISHPQLVEAIARVRREMWAAYMRVDEPAHTKCFAPDYRAVHPDGSVHVGAPGAAEIAATPIEKYWWTEQLAWPIGDQAAIATYTAEVQLPGTTTHYKFAVGEVWILSGGSWKCRYYQATPLRD